MSEDSECTASRMPVERYPFQDWLTSIHSPRLMEIVQSGRPVRVQLPYGPECWLVTTYDDCRQVLSDPRFSRSMTLGRDVPRLVPFIQTVSSILTLDPPDHTRLRQVVNRWFSPRGVHQFQPDVECIATELVKRLKTLPQPADLVSEVTSVMPVRVMSRILGVPAADDALFRCWGRAFRSSGHDAWDAVAECGVLPWDYLRRLVEKEFISPSSSLLGSLVEASSSGHLSIDEVVSFAVTLLLAGQGTTTDEMGNVFYYILRDTSLKDRILSDLGLVPRAVEELLRFSAIGTLTGFARVATQDVVVGEVTISKGDFVVVQADAANRDFRVFEDPHGVHIFRGETQHLAFGYGPHHCLGANLARRQIAAIVQTVLSECPKISLVSEGIEWRQASSSRGPVTLNVEW